MEPEISGLVVEPLLENIIIYGLMGGERSASQGHSHYDDNTKVVIFNKDDVIF